MPSGTQCIEAALIELVAQGQSSAQIADAAVLTWNALHSALAPVIGARGVQALYRRSLYLTRDNHSCFDDGREAGEPGDFVGLRAALAQQTTAVAAAGHAALLHNFLGLLTNLIGESLTERLLRSVWVNLPGGHAAQDIAP